MNSDKYNPNAITPDECFANVEFQFGNVKGWMSVPNPDNALVKAENLLEATQKLIESLKAVATTPTQ